MPHNRNSISREINTEVDLVRTKFARPVLRSSRIIRDRLIRIADASDQKGVVMIVAPSGYGKTTLLSEWAEISTGAVAWLSLSNTDNDLLRFWRYLTASLKQVIPAVSDRSLKRLSLIRKPPFETHLNPLISEIASHPNQVSLFLDDLQEILDPAIHASLATFLDLAPPNLRVFIGSRSTPFMTLDRMKRSTPTRVVKTKEIAFSLSEAYQYFDATVLKPVPVQVRETLVKRSEGWIVGLQIACYGLRDAENPCEFAESFSGNQGNLLEFFRSQVLGEIFPSFREFVIKTSVLDRFCAELCDAVLVRTDSSNVISQLASSDIFVIPLDESHTWFRYHSLFRDVAIQTFEETYPEESAAVRERATVWFERQGCTEESAMYSVESGNWSRVVALVDPIANELITTNRAGRVQSWIFRLPIESLNNAPYLSVRLARMMMVGDVHADLEPYLVGPERKARQKEDRVLLTAVESLRAHQMVLRGAAKEAIPICESCLDRLPASETFYRGITLRVLGMAQLLIERPIWAEATFKQSESYSVESNNWFTALCSQALRAVSLGVLGRVQDGLDLIDQTVAMCEQKFDVQPVLIPFAHSMLLYEAWRLDEAAHVLRDLDGLCDETGYRVYAAHFRMMRAKVSWAMGETEEADENLQIGRTLSENFGSAMGLFEPNVVQCQMRFCDGDVEATRGWERTETARLAVPGRARKQLLVQKIRAWQALELGDTVEVDRCVERITEIRQIAKLDDRRIDEVDAIIPLALIQFELGQREQAIDLISDAIRIAQPCGILRPFMEERVRLVPVMELLEQRELCLEFLSILATAEGESSGQVTVKLTDRELEILKLLSQGFQNDEIARHIVLPEATVRAYVKRVYAKLGAHPRFEPSEAKRDAHQFSD